MKHGILIKKLTGHRDCRIRSVYGDRDRNAMVKKESRESQ
jgi:hypothetical protein